MLLNRYLRFPSPKMAQTLQTALVASMLVAALGCSLHRANHAFSEGRYEDATREYQAILRKDPGNVQARNGYRRAAPLAATEHIEKAKVLNSRGQLDETALELKRALMLDPNNTIAMDELAVMQMNEQRRKAKESAEDYSTAKAQADATAPSHGAGREWSGAPVRRPAGRRPPGFRHRPPRC